MLAGALLLGACAGRGGAEGEAPGSAETARPADGPGAAPPVLEVRTPREDAMLRIARIETEPRSLRLTVGEKAPFRVIALDADGMRVPNAPLNFFGADSLIALGTDSVVGVRAGQGTLFVEVPAPADVERTPIRAAIPVRVTDAGASPDEAGHGKR